MNRKHVKIKAGLVNTDFCILEFQTSWLGKGWVRKDEALDAENSRSNGCNNDLWLLCASWFKRGSGGRG